MPQPPQSTGFLVVSTQAPPHRLVAPGHMLVHAPALQAWPAGHVAPHAPQFIGSFAV
jgi:hypothetical protein